MSEKSKRDILRSKLLGNAPKPQEKIVTLFGAEVAIRQPTLASVLEAQDIQDTKERSINMFIRYAYVPGTNERVFEATDKDVMLAWPFGGDLVRLQEVIAELTGVDISREEVQLKENPSSGQ